MLFDVIYLLALLLLSPAILWRRIRTGKYRGIFAKRRGFVPVRPEHPCRIWIHAVSVGEANVARPLTGALRELRPDCDFVVSTITPTGQEVAVRNFGEANVFYCPFDFSWMVRRAFERTRPMMLVLMELELWPNLIREAARRGVPVVVVNGRISDRAFPRYRRWRWAFSSTLKRLDAFCAQDKLSAERAVAMGMPADRVHGTGNLKYDAVNLQPDPEQVAQLRRQFSLADDARVVVAGSTHPSEEAAVAEACMTLREEFADLRLIVVPRHPERFDGAARDVEAKGWPVWRLSTTDQAPDAVAPAGAAILVDRMGVLLSAWRLATVAFVGGSLIPHGGQNPLEPAGLGVATVFGPHMFNFREVVKSLLDRDACTQIQEALQLPSALRDLLADPDLRRVRGERAREAVAAMRGAGARTAELLAPMLRRGDEESEDRSRE